MADATQPGNILDAANIIAACGLLLAVIVFVAQIFSTNRDRQHQKSRFALDATLEGLEHAYNLLKDGSNDRVNWVAAARALKRTDSITAKVTEQVHKDALAIHIDKYRILFSAVLGFNDPAKLASFFYGVGLTTTDIDTAAKESSKRNGSQPKLSNLPEAAIWSVFKAASFPDDYDDPLAEDHGLMMGSSIIL